MIVGARVRTLIWLLRRVTPSIPMRFESGLHFETDRTTERLAERAGGISEDIPLRPGRGQLLAIT